MFTAGSLPAVPQVAYLSLTQWLDSRQEKKDQEEEKNPKKPTFTTSQ